MFPGTRPLSDFEVRILAVHSIGIKSAPGIPAREKSPMHLGCVMIRCLWSAADCKSAKLANDMDSNFFLIYQTDPFLENPLSFLESAMRLPGFIPLLAFCLLLTSGCSMFTSFGDMWHQSMRSMTPRTGDYDDTTDEVDEGWIKEAGIEARGDRPIEYENDPFRVLMSPKAKSIERNLGIQ